MKKIFIVLGITAILILGAVFAFAKLNFTGNAVENGEENKTTLKVAIPCPGHAWLIESWLDKLDGVSNVEFRFPNYFDVTYDSAKVSKQEILSLNIFKEYKATEVKP